MSIKTLLTRRIVKKLGIAALVLGAFLAALIVSVAFLDDPVSAALRAHTEDFLDAQSDRLYRKARDGELTRGDRTVLHAATLTGIGMAWVSYPEAGAILFHYVYGDGAELELSSEYFSRSPYLSSKIAELGSGRHGPIAFQQSCDWRLSLALNPYYLDVDEDRVRLSHPRIEFVPVSGPPTPTVVPMGKLRVRVYDNLVSALSGTPFSAHAEWTISPHD